MIEHVIFRSQLLSALVERRPGSPDTISDFGHLLLLESYHLAQVFRTFSSCHYLNFFSDVRALVAEDSRLFWMDPKLHFVSTPLEFAQHLLKLLF